MIFRLRNNPYLKRSNILDFKEKFKKLRQLPKDTEKLAQVYIQELEEANDELLALSEKLQEEIPSIRKKSDEIKNFIHYNNHLKSFITRYLYSEADYATASRFMSIVKKRLEIYKKDPSLLFSTN